MFPLIVTFGLIDQVLFTSFYVLKKNAVFVTFWHPDVGILSASFLVTAIF